jgi:hypothetical protein
MIAVEITNPEGLAKIRQELNRIASGSCLRAPMEASLIELETYMKKYPPKPAAIQGPAMSPVRFSTKAGKSAEFMARSRGWSRNNRGRLYYEGYKRTGKLGQLWLTRVEGNGTMLTGHVGNNIKYAPYVQSAAKQAWMHVGRWRTDAQAITQFQAKIVRRFQDAIDRATR